MPETPPPPASETAAAGLPASAAERTNVIIHYYRAESARMTSWRDRLDRTTNWAITVVAALLSVSLSTPDSHHGVLVFAMLLVSVLLLLEARRYRFFDVYRARVRRLERQYFAQVLAPLPDPEPDPDWALWLAADLRVPQFRISIGGALSRRLKRNYMWLYLILLLSWVVKITSVKLQAADPTDSRLQPLYRIVENAGLGPIPGGAVLAVVTLFYLLLGWLTLRRRERAGEMLHGNVHV